MEFVTKKEDYKCLLQILRPEETSKCLFPPSLCKARVVVQNKWWCKFPILLAIVRSSSPHHTDGIPPPLGGRPVEKRFTARPQDENQALGTYTQPRALSRRDGSDKLRGRHERERARVSLALARAVHRTPWKAVNFRLSSEKSAGLGLDRRRSRLSG